MGLRDWIGLLGGAGAFQEGAELLVSFAFETVGVHRLESPGRGPQRGAATARCARWERCRKGVLRSSFLKDGEYLDQALWTILDEGLESQTVWSRKEAMILH